VKHEITISELAKLMNVSTHQIRYFEEKGVLKPAYTDDNQYRMYGKGQYHRWAQDTPDLPPTVNALLKAREKTLKNKNGREARELRSEVAKHGVVVRDKETRQYWRMQAAQPR